MIKNTTKTLMLSVGLLMSHGINAATEKQIITLDLSLPNAAAASSAFNSSPTASELGSNSIQSFKMSQYVDRGEP